MAITYGFYNSVNGDRKYSAEQFTELISSMITEGVFENIGFRFRVSDYGNATISVGEGRCWFNGVWIKNDSIERVDLETWNPSNPDDKRIDLVCLYVDKENRTAGIRVKAGYSSTSTPDRPITTANELPIAELHRVYNAARGSAINKIVNLVGTSDCPYVTATLPIKDISNVLNAWGSEFKEWWAAVKDVYASEGGVPVPEVKVIAIAAAQISSNSNTIVANVSVPKGLWHIDITLRFAETGSTFGKGPRWLKLIMPQTLHDGLSSTVFSDIEPGSNSDYQSTSATYLKVHGILRNNSSSEKTVSVQVYQNSGQTMVLDQGGGTLTKLAPSYTLIS